MSRRIIVIAVIAIAAIVLIANTLFVVDQREQAIVLRLGDPVRVVNAPGGGSGPGLNAKLPFLENVIKLDRRNLWQEADKEEIIAADKERLVVDAFVRYRISDPLQYYRTLRDDQTASDRIERLVNSSLRQVLGSATQSDIVSGRRAQLMAQIRNDLVKRAASSQLGIRIIDVRIKRADLPTQNQEFVYRRMQTSRQQQSALIRAQGEQQLREIRGAADKEVAITLATAQEEAQTTRGAGDAQRTRILAQAYGKDPSFAAFYRSMNAYEASLANGDTTMVLSPDSEFFRYFQRGPGGR